MGPHTPTGTLVTTSLGLSFALRKEPPSFFVSSAPSDNASASSQLPW